MRKDDRAGLLVVDVQNDFCAGGALPVPNAEQVVNALNRYIEEAAANRVSVYASRDWHPPESNHFKPFGGPWPVHCVRNTEGARFHPNLRLPASVIVITKGEDAGDPGYSAFEGHTEDGQRFPADLRGRGINHLYVGGLATDYCVKHSVLDAVSAGLQVTLLEDAIAGVDPHDSARAITEMRRSGTHVAAGSGLLTRGSNRWEHFAHGADVGIRGIGLTKEAAFEQIALALTSVITDLTSVRPEHAVPITCDAPTDDLLVVDWLNALVYEMATRRMLFSTFVVAIDNSHVQATAWGEPVNAIRHEPAVEVKGATYTALRVEQLADGKWLAQCVVDV